MILLDLPTLNKYDHSGMHKIYDRWPELARESYELKTDAVDFQGIDHIVFAGMGGSGTVGDIFSSGGKMQEYCTKNKLEHRSFQQVHSPRASFPIFLYCILKALGTVIPMK